MFKTKSLLKQLIRKISNYTYVEVHKTRQPDICVETHKKKNICNRDMLPIGMTFFGNYENKDHKCTISKNGMYIVNDKQYGSLSEAAKAVTSVRTEGWRFWKLYTKGPSVLEMFRKKEQ
jgi:hypothetical protein